MLSDADDALKAALDLFQGPLFSLQYYSFVLIDTHHARFDTQRAPLQLPYRQAFLDTLTDHEVIFSGKGKITAVGETAGITCAGYIKLKIDNTLDVKYSR